MPKVIEFPDGTQVEVQDEEDEQPAHLRRGRFDRRKRVNETERQRIERGLAKMAEVGKEFLLADDDDDIGVIAGILKARKIVE